MSKVLLLWLLTYFGGLALLIVNPIYPFISYLTFYYLPPQKNWWGTHLPEFRWSLLASAAMVAALAINSSKLERLKKVRNPALPWLLLFGANIVLVTLWAVDRARSWLWTVALLKLILLYLLIPAVIRTPAHFDMFATAHITGATYWGWKAWDDPKRRSGRLTDVGGPDTQNENGAAAHLLTVLPFVAVYVLTSRRRWVQAATAVGGAFIVNCLILCNSRGSIVGLLTMVGATIAWAGKGKRLRLIGVAAAGLAALLVLADPEFIARQQTTVQVKDGSSQGRLEAWAASLEFMQDYPLGTGGRGFHILSPKYIPDIVEASRDEERSVHNTYLQLAAEWGLQGLAVWGMFIASTLLLIGRARRKAAGQSDFWYFYRLLAVQLGLIGQLVAGVFTNRLYAESVYWMCALGFALYRMYETNVEDQASPAPHTTKPVAAQVA